MVTGVCTARSWLAWPSWPGIWTLASRADYISLLASGTYLATAYILVVAGVSLAGDRALGC